MVGWVFIKFWNELGLMLHSNLDYILFNLFIRLFIDMDLIVQQDEHYLLL